MIGTKTSTQIVLQPRDRKVIATLEQLDLATQAQLAEICGFSSRTRASARLSVLVSSGHLGRQYVGTIAGGRRAVYMLSGKKVTSKRGPAGLEAAIQHRLAVADIFVGLDVQAKGGRLAFSWAKIPTTIASLGLIPDAQLTISAPGLNRSCFLELDYGSEGMSIWRSKVSRYLSVANDTAQLAQLGVERFSVLVICSSEARARRIRRTIAERTDKVFWITSIQSFTSVGASSPIWLRPTGDKKHSLI